MAPLDLKKVAAEASAQHGVRVDLDDPLMVVVTVNRLVFEYVIAAVMEKLDATTRAIDTATARVQVRAGSAIAQELKQCFVEFEREARKQIEAVGQSDQRRQTESASVAKWVSLGLAAGLLLILAGFWIGARFGSAGRVG